MLRSGNLRDFILSPHGRVVVADAAGATSFEGNGKITTADPLFGKHRTRGGSSDRAALAQAPVSVIVISGLAIATWNDSNPHSCYVGTIILANQRDLGGPRAGSRAGYQSDRLTGDPCNTATLTLLAHAL